MSADTVQAPNNVLYIDWYKLPDASLGLLYSLLAGDTSLEAFALA